jgi:hypothetical protein
MREMKCNNIYCEMFPTRAKFSDSLEVGNKFLHTHNIKCVYHIIISMKKESQKANVSLRTEYQASSLQDFYWCSAQASPFFLRRIKNRKVITFYFSRQGVLHDVCGGSVVACFHKETRT